MNNYLVVIDENLVEFAHSLAEFTHDIIVLRTHLDIKYPYLFLDMSGLSILCEGFKPIIIRDIYSDLRIRAKNLASEMLIQTIKSKSANNNLTVFDLTAGLGKDASLLGWFGFKVLIVEQNALLATVLYYALSEGFLPSEQMSLIYGDSIQFLSDYQGPSPDVIYLDPMFKDTKVAKSKKEIQIIQNIVLDQDNSQNKLELLFTKSQALATKKIVVKRDNKQASIVHSTKVSYVKLGKTIRYDVYII